MQTPFAVGIPEETRRLVEPLPAACFAKWATKALSDEGFPVLEEPSDRAAAEAVELRSSRMQPACTIRFGLALLLWYNVVRCRTGGAIWPTKTVTCLDNRFVPVYTVY